MQGKWEMSCWQSGHNSLHEAPPDEEWVENESDQQKTFIKYWKKINPKNKKQLIQFVSRACTFYTFNYIVEPFSTKELRRVYEMYMNQRVIHSKTKLGLFVLGQFNSLSKIIKEAKLPKHIKSFDDLTKLNFGPELYNALTNFANSLNEYQKYNANWQDYIPLEIALQKRSLIPSDIQSTTHRSWDYRTQTHEEHTYYSFREQDQSWNFIGLIKRETKHKMDIKWKSSPWYKEIQLEQKLLGN